MIRKQSIEVVNILFGLFSLFYQFRLAIKLKLNTMSATFKLAKQKQNDLRRLMSEQKSKQQAQAPTKKIDSPLAKYPFQFYFTNSFFRNLPN